MDGVSWNLDRSSARLRNVGISEVTSRCPGTECGVFTRAELDRSGMTAGDRTAAIAAGTLTKLRRNWFAVSGHDPEVAHAVQRGGVLSCVSALNRYGVWVPPGYPETHVRYGRSAATDEGCCRGYSRIRAGETAVDSIVVALECAARCMTDEDWIAVCDSVQNKFRVSAQALRAEMGPLPRRVLDLFAKTDRHSQSGTESVARVRLCALGFDVQVQPHFPGAGHSDLRIGKLILECDGELYHSSAAEFQADRTRDRKTLIGGFITMRFTYDDIIYGWDEALEDIRAITGKRRHRVRPFRGTAPRRT